MRKKGVGNAENDYKEYALNLNNKPMKILKKILLSLFVGFFCLSIGYSQDLIEVSDSGNSFLVEESSIITSINNFINAEEGFDPGVTSVQIVQDGSQYYLVASGGDYKVAIGLEPSGTSGAYKFAGITCVTKDCSNNPDACIPNSAGTACSICITGDCVKTITSNNLLSY